MTRIDLDTAAAVAAVLVHRLEGLDAVGVALPDGTVTVAVGPDSTLSGVVSQVRSAPRSPGRADVVVGVTGPVEGATVADFGPVTLSFGFDWVGADHTTERLETLLQSLDAGLPVRRAAVVGPTERKLLLSFNPPPTAAPRIPVHELICRQAARTPDRLALRGDGVDRTYRQLLDDASRVAGRLRADGVGPGSVVGLCTERSADMVVAVLGILLAGAAYLPLDPTHPRARLDVMLDVADAALVLVSAEAAPLFEGHRVPVRPLTAGAEPVAWQDYQAPASVVDGLSYVIFTSGSTGQPKGVQMTHLSLANRLAWMQDEYRLRPDDVVLHKTPYTFDVSVWELLWAFAAGARLVVAPAQAHRDPRELVDLIEREGVTTVHFVPSMLSLFVGEDDVSRCASLHRVICSGEALPPKVVNKLTESLPDVEVHNLYGPTEAAIDVTAWACRKPEPDSGVPIGRPITNVATYVLDADGDLAPLGAPGELVLGGHCLARGYAGRPDLTADRFVRVEVSGTAERVYRTGDLVWWSPAGHLNYVGRIDTQVKIRGQRVELSEIESVLNRHPLVANSVVVLRTDLGTTPALVAYVVPEPDAACDDLALRAHLGEHLPDHMVPLRYVALAALPATANGKVDRRALPVPQPRTRRRAG
ncbi:amino acid adenylation domain-containing protein [Actinokineospora alba]|uniref:Amino acid adenylation domain-containing protein n=1 Tax=Actinokineospora alba TaxID=504798 RepID=A0A1H0FB51_9PSEU|nr:amino acid adenylation domain-containing protein [Actinokineospora alba]TDP69412.1 amino acid adenylation domain-containing protein [Actinokineospora alba]SDI17299.1 amino acid adenylation domain-containing protein [Actinokineospora alba]SDN91893.1 amino acid adenylation domain-containing protein [Actinokineospora alba]